MTPLLMALSLAVQDGRELYMQRCFFCHGETGRGDGPSAAGMFPRPRDFVRADYRIRTTPFGSLPTDEDLFRAIRDGLPGTPMSPWKGVLTDEQIRSLVAYLKTLSDRFQKETREAVAIPPEPPDTPESRLQGRKLFERMKCSLCHGDEGRGDGPIVTTLHAEWGLPYPARNLHKGWTFKGGASSREIFTRITTGLNGTPMGPYAELLDDAERWDLAHYVGSLNDEPATGVEEFLLNAAWVEGPLPEGPDDPAWAGAAAVTFPLAGQIVQDPPSRWWTPTALSVTARALWNERRIAFLLEWDDPTESDGDSATLQFPVEQDGRPYFLHGDADNPVVLWRWTAPARAGAFSTDGGVPRPLPDASLRAAGLWRKGRWSVVLSRALGGDFDRGRFVPLLFSIQDASNGERENVRAISTWYYVTLSAPGSPRPYLSGAAYLFGGILALVFILRRVRRKPA